MARRGVLTTPHGDVPTPAFMPVGTYGTVKGMTPPELREIGTGMVLSNAMHLWVRPGDETIRDLGGLHTFMGWDGPILTDSGGYQVFSLRHLTKVTEEGVRFRTPKDGQYRKLTPEVCVRIQENLGVDLAMAFDECIEWPAERDRVIASTARTTRWLKRCQAARQHPDRTALLGIVQGGFYDDLRVAHAQEIVEAGAGLGAAARSVDAEHHDGFGIAVLGGHEGVVPTLCRTGRAVGGVIVLVGDHQDDQGCVVA